MIFKKVTIHIGIITVPFIRTRGPTPSDENIPQAITEPPPNFTDFFTHLGLSLSPVTRRTYCLPSDPTKLNLLSSLKCTLSQSLSLQRI